ncbi:hypothetical protein MVEN_00883700 [Mycena venus]|uniref:Uncharacterized protein n=1 Tax=Mycena venus TaxID=2733690 RepID=A0A8H6YHF0_9AGAR|nr:hypothetical protein MVEN_00883700 [Mycena venus]
MQPRSYFRTPTRTVSNIMQKTRQRNFFPFSKLFESHATDEKIPLPWVYSCTEVIGGLILDLCEAHKVAVAQEESNVAFVEPVKAVKTGKRGRPRKQLDARFVAEAMAPHRKITVTALAKIMGDMCLMGQVQEGVYVEDYDNVHPTVLARHYGVHGPEARRLPGQTGAGQLNDEDVPVPLGDANDSDSDDEDDLEAQITEAHADNFHHEPVPVPKHAEPFDDKAVMQLFYDMLSEADENDMVFPGYGLLQEEWEDGLYPSFEILKIDSFHQEKKKENTANLYRVISVYINPYGTELDDEGTLQITAGHDKTPDKFQMQKAVDDGLAVVNSTEGFEFDRTWTFDQLVDALMGLLPLPFSFFAQADEPGWYLATVVQRRLQVLANLTHPTGADVDYHKGSSTNGFRNNRVFIVSRQPIPAKMLGLWAKQCPEPGPSHKSSADSDKEELVSEDSDCDSGSFNNTQSPERIPLPNKRRLFSKSSSDEEEFAPPKKKGKGVAGRTWTREPEAGSHHTGSSGRRVIDLTADDAVPEKAASKSRASSEESIVEDPTIWDPYDKKRVYNF